MRSVSSLWTLPIWSFQRVSRTVAVSSPTVASTSFLASPNFDVISRSSLNPTTFTKTFTCLDAGVRSFTFVIVFSSMLSLLPTQAAESQRVGKNLPPGEFRRCGLTVLTNRCYKNIRKRWEREGTVQVRSISESSGGRSIPDAANYLARPSDSTASHARRCIRSQRYGHPCQRHETMQLRMHLLSRRRSRPGSETADASRR